jgi:hypothetical protein
MPRHIGIARFRGLQPESAGLIQREGRRLLGDLMNRLKLSGVRVGKSERVLPDGTRIIAQWDGTTPTVTAILPRAESPETETDLTLWVPRGFVVEPATEGIPLGWGLPPIAPGEDADPLNPGPLPAAWTEGGALPQVLLSRVDDAGYPPLGVTVLPMYYDGPEQTDPIDLPDEAAAWAAYRPSFLDVGTDATAVLTAINASRPDEAPLSLPLRGPANLATWYAQLVTTYGTDDANYPTGSDTAAKRTAKDGTAHELGTGLPVGALARVDTTGATTPAQVADALIAALPDLSDAGALPNGTTLALAGGGALTLVAAIDQTEQWARCGNLDWVSINAEIPRLSWCGPQGRSIPPRELAAGRRTASDTAGELLRLDTLTTTFQGREFRLFDRFVYARGRILAQLPDDGYVLGAAVQRIDATDDTPAIYRLIVLGWHRADQFNSTGVHDPDDVFNYDTTSDVRVWYADLPTRNGLACSPDRMVEDGYDVDANPSGWHMLARHRLWGTEYAQSGFHGPGVYLGSGAWTGYSDPRTEACSPKTYWQPWFFNGSGTEAVCLRASVFIDSFFDSGPAVHMPAQAFKIAVDATPASSIALVWELAEQSNIGSSVDAIYAWDYDGDTERVARVTGVDSPDPALVVYDTEGAEIGTNVLFSTDQTTLWHFDARTNTYTAVQQTLTDVSIGGDDFYMVAAVAIRLVVDGVEQATASGSVPDDMVLGFSLFGSIGTLGFFDRDRWSPSDYPHPRFMLGAARRGLDHVWGLWYGARPGDLTGTIGAGQPPLEPIDDYRTYARASASSFAADTLTGVSGGWLNFAGVI